MIEAQKLVKGQKLRVELDQVKDRLSENLISQLSKDSCGILVGYKMVDGNAFGLVLEFSDSSRSWFFEHELSEVPEPLS